MLLPILFLKRIIPTINVDNCFQLQFQGFCYFRYIRYTGKMFLHLFIIVMQRKIYSNCVYVTITLFISCTERVSKKSMNRLREIANNLYLHSRA